MEKDPQAGARVAQAEMAVEAGKLSEAAEQYRQVRQMAPQEGLGHRRHCELLTALGRRPEAQQACRLALEFGSSVRDLRASVQVIMMPGKQPPSVDDFMDAATMANGARRQLPGQPDGYVAMAEIAKRLGDWDMMRTQLVELDRVAPDHADTQRAHALAARPQLRWRLLGWGALLLVCLTAVGRVVRKELQRRLARTQLPTGSTAVVALTLVLGLAAMGWGAPAQAATKPAKAAKPAEVEEQPPPANALSEFKIDDADPVGSLPLDKANANPLQFAYLLMDIAGKAEDAQKRGDHAQAIKYYQSLAKAAPQQSIAYGRMCKVYQAMGDRNSALDACRGAMGRNGASLDDYRRFVDLVVGGGAELTAQEKEDVIEVVKHLRAGPPESLVLADELQCQFATRTGDMKLLEGCVAGLVKAVPKEGKTLTYQWSLAMAKGDLSEAARLVQRAKFAGIKPEGVAKMTEATKALQKSRGRLPIWGGIVAAAAVISLGFRYLRRNRGGAMPAQHPA